MSNASIIAESLGVSKISSGEWYRCKCPVHDDKKPSLGIKDGEKGSVIFKCLAGCEGRDIANYFKNKGFRVDREKDLHLNSNNNEAVERPLKKENANSLARVEVCRYQYISVEGELLYEKIRYEPKSFMIVNPNGNGTNGHIGALYGAHHLSDIKGKTVYITEGEKDVDSLTKLGFIACTSGGASNWPEQNNHLFSGVNIRILPDNDDPGIGYAKKVEKSLNGTPLSIKTMFPPSQYSDVSDWVEDGAIADDINDLFNTHKFKTMSFSDILELKSKTDWLIKNYISKNSLSQIFGESGCGKSFLALEMAYCVAAGIGFFNSPSTKSDVLYIAGEGFSGFSKRSKALQDKHGSEIECFEFSMQAAEILSESSCEDVRDRIIDNDGFDLVVIDTLNRNMGDGDENSTKDMTKFITNVDKYIRSTGSAVLIIHHSGLANKERARGSGSVYGSLDHQFRVDKNDSNDMAVTCTKNKEGEIGWQKALKLKPVVVGYDDEECEDVYSCILEDNENDVDILNERDQAVLDALRQASIEDGDSLTIDDVVVYAVNEDNWRDIAYKRLEGRKNKRRDFALSRDVLIKKQMVFVENNMFYCL